MLDEDFLFYMCDVNGDMERKFIFACTAWLIPNVM